MTMIEQYQPLPAQQWTVPSEPPQVTYLDPTGGRLESWAKAAVAANQLAKALVKTQFVPQAFKNNEGDATAVIIMGDELGLSPLAALRSIYAVHGQPALYARTMVALAQSRGHEVWTEKSTDAEVVVCGRRRGSDHTERSSWTISRAQKAGYTSNKKYASNPQEMLFSKAAAEIARKVAADVLAGVPYSVEDLELEQPESTTTVTRSAGTTKAQRKAKEPSPKPEEPAFDEPAPDVTAEDLITEQQSKLLHKLFRDEGMDRDASLQYLTSLLDHEVTTTKDLTKAEASAAIDTLTPDGDGPAEPTLDGE